jgi:hypothetical protein
MRQFDLLQFKLSFCTLCMHEGQCIVVFKPLNSFCLHYNGQPHSLHPVRNPR